MSNPEQVQPNASEEEINEIWNRLERLNASDRRRTFEHFQTPPQVAQAQAEKTPEKNITVETASRRIKNFSGLPKPANNEQDYKHWRRAAARIADDNELSESQKRRYILQSLVGQAEDAVDLHRHEDTHTILHVLDTIYGSTLSGFDLLADFYQVLQTDETASEYLKRLYLLLTEIVDLDGLPMHSVPSELLRQFIRGTSDEELLTKTRLESRSIAPNVPDLFTIVRREESKRTERRLRHKKKVRSRQQVASVVDEPDEDSDPEAEIAQVRQQLSKLEQKIQKKRAKGFCYLCGEDGHHVPDCSNPPNQELVRRKLSERKASNP